MSERFIKFIPSENADFLQENFPNCFLLLTQIAKTARRTPNGIDGLEIGDAIVGEIETSKKAGLSTKEYRNALEKLEELGIIETVFNPMSKKPQKRAIKRAIKSKIVNLKSSDIWDINPVIEGDQKGDLRASRGRPEGDKQERIRKNKNEKEEIHTADLAVVENVDNFSLELNDKIDYQKNLHNITYTIRTNSEESQTNPELKQKKSNKVKIKKSKEPNPDLVERRPNIQTSDDQHKKLIEAHSQELVNAAYDYLDRWKESKKEKDPKAVDAHTDYYRITQWVFKAVKDEKVTDKSDSNTPIENNKKYAKKISENYQSFAYTMEPLNQAFEFTPKTSGRPLFVDYELSESIFKEKVQEKINTLKFKEIEKT